MSKPTQKTQRDILADPYAAIKTINNTVGCQFENVSWGINKNKLNDTLMP